ncbi:MAG: homocysteine S-methyltransferase family protein [Shimia sp.]
MSSITILDGGMGQELVKRAGKATDLWSLKALMEAPEMVRAVHDDFFAAGAQVVTTNSYCCLPDRLDPKGYGDQLGALTRRACELAVAARDAHGFGIVAGGFGPQGFSYQADKAPPAAEAAEVYARVAAVMGDMVDVYLFETMASVDQARGALMSVAGRGKPVWVAVTLDDVDGTKLRSGEAVTELLPMLAEYGPDAVLLNCSPPEAVSQAIPLLTGHGWQVGAYANGFVNITDDFDNIHATVDQLTTRKDLSPEVYLSHARDWAAAGATIIGGCCEIGPDHIRALADHFEGVPV